MLIESLRIEEVVGEFVELKKSGSSYKGLCPFHQDTSPSFMVSPSKNICKCFVCGAGGNPIKFYSEYKKKKSISGMIAAFQGFSVKASMGLASAVIGLFLKIGGYVPNAVQSEKALSYIEVSFIWIPMVLCAGLFITTCFYRLDKEVGVMKTELDNRRLMLVQEEDS